MSVIDDLATAVGNYANDACNTTITAYSVTTGTSTGPTATLNSGDEFQFAVMVFNNGEFDMKNVRIRVNGSNWADVALSGPTGVFGSTALLDPTAPINIDAHGSFLTGFFRGKAKAGADTNGVNKDIVTAQIDGWNGVWDHVLNDRSGAGAVEGKLSKEVVPA